MRFNYRVFDVEIERQVDVNLMSWPGPGEAEREEAFGFWIGNQSYYDLQGIEWDHALRIADAEQECIRCIEKSPDPSETGSSSVADAAMVYLDLDLAQIWDELGAAAMLDVGVASTVVALSASGQIPFTSCNAGAFGGWHPEDYPLVVFCAHPDAVDLLMECAEYANVGLQNTSGAYGPITVYADDVRKFSVFADAIFERRAGFASLQA